MAYSALFAPKDTPLAVCKKKMNKKSLNIQKCLLMWHTTFKKTFSDSDSATQGQGKVLSRLILNHVSGRIYSAIPNEQYGFMPGKSTLQVVEQLLAEMHNSLKRPKGCLY
jgi:hypothetical protein